MKDSRFFHRRVVRDAGIALALAAVAALVWCWFYYRLNPASWKTPVSIGGDAMIIMSAAQAAQEGDFTPWLLKAPHRLGAPFTAGWNSWPITEELLFWTIGIASRAIGLPAALSLAMMTVHALAAASFYWACRLLGKRRLPSAVFALLFGLSYFIFMRGLGHITVGYCWHVPLCWAVVCYAFSARGIFKNRRRAALACAVAAATGLQNPYYMAVFVQFLGLAFIAQVVRRRSWSAVLGPVVVAAVAVAAFASMQADTLLDRLVNHRGSLGVQRYYTDIEAYALKPMDLLLPLHWHLPFLERVATIYAREKVVTAEHPFAFLGMAAAIGAIWLALLSFRDLTLRGGRLSAPVRQYAVPAAWVVALGMVGGLVGMGALLSGAYFLRGANRFSVFIVALMLFFLVDAFTSAARRLPRWAALLAAALPLLAGGVDVWLMRPPEAAIAATGVDWRGYGQFVDHVEKTAGRGAMLFNLPAVDFPETVPLNGEDTYAPLLLYTARPSTLRFSFGNMRGDYCDSWQRACANLPPEQMAAQLRRYGFGGIVVSRGAYADRAKALLASLSAATGQPAAFTPTGDLAFVPLRTATATPTDKAPLPNAANIALASGWWPIEYFPNGEPLLWTRGDATLALYRDPSLDPRTPAALSLNVSTQAARTLRLSCRGKTLVTLAMRPNYEYPLDALRLLLQPGWNILHLRTDQPPARRLDVPKDTRTVAVLARGLRASGLALGGESRPPAGVQVTVNGELTSADRATIDGAAAVGITDAAGRRWQEVRAAAAGQLPARRIEFLPNGQSFCVLARVAFGPTQGAYATVLSCLTPDAHGFTLERMAGDAPRYLCAIGDGVRFLPVGEPVQLLPGHKYLAALNISGQGLTLRLRGDDGSNATLSCAGPEVARLGKAYWLWGDWLPTGRPFAGRIELLSLGDALSPDEIERLLERHAGEISPITASSPAP